MADTQESGKDAIDIAEAEAVELVSKISLEDIQLKIQQFLEQIVEWAQSPQFYAQLGLVATAVIFAFLVAKIVGKNFKPRSQPPQPGSMSKWRGFLYKLRGVLFSLFALVFLGLASALSEVMVQQSWLIKIAQGLAVITVIYSVTKQFVSSSAVKNSLNG